MSQRNGGTVHTSSDAFQLFPFFDATDRKRIQRTCGSIDRETLAARKTCCGFPPEAVAIGANGGGDLLVLIPVSDLPSQQPVTLQHVIYWWDHETSELEAVAMDFSELKKSSL